MVFAKVTSGSGVEILEAFLRLGKEDYSTWFDVKYTGFAAFGYM